MQTLAIDSAVFNAIHTTNCSGSNWDQINLFISNYSFFLWMGILLIYVLVKKKVGLYPALICFSSFIIAWFITDEFLKPLFHRDRPFIELGTCVFGKKPHNESFPSGHTLTAFTIATVFCLFNLKNRLLCIFGFLFSLLIGYTRIYLGVHFPTDILGGIAFGTLIGAIWYQTTEWARRNFQPETGS
ncbi:MAG: phosphatase PAP2 family protein [Candidatus Caenarcaniphilales bacterium]|nr:phosphatase PAP2 family protein [Candidatus Caenarcaniphilales bacterium]